MISDPNELWIDDLYDMEEGQLRREVERYAGLARRYPHPSSKNHLAYEFAFIRHEEAMKLLEARSNE
jgi:hypothetical protein